MRGTFLNWLAMSHTRGPTLFQAVSHAKIYSRFRPTYPSSVMTKVISFLSEKCSRPFELAADIGCGSGQSSRSLSPHFQEVVGLDVSEAQLQQAREVTTETNVSYRKGSADEIPFSDRSIDVITCAQSMHWFDIPKFYKEAKRALKPNGCLIVYGYGVTQPRVPCNEEVQIAMQDEYKGIYTALGPFWDARRPFVETRYRDVQLPFKELKRDDSLVMETPTTVDDMIGYIRSWSAHQTYIEKFPEKADFLPEHRHRFLELIQPSNPDLPADKIQFSIVAPIFILMGRDTID